jgi:hypothetical protein
MASISSRVQATQSLHYQELLNLSDIDEWILKFLESFSNWFVFCNFLLFFWVYWNARKFLLIFWSILAFWP